MAWWGKLVGGTVGFMLGGPLGAMLGATFGHNFDAGTARKSGQGYFPKNQERTQMAFFSATFSVMGHVAKADGQVSKSEIAMAKQLMAHMQLQPEQKKLAIKLFNQGRRSDFPLEQILQQFKQECHRQTNLVRMFLEIQIQAALADGNVDPAEKSILTIIADTLGFSLADLERLINMVQSASASASGEQQLSIDQANQILGITDKTTTADAAKAYRRLMSQHHPDKLVSKGLPEEMIKLANEKTHEIRRAWKRVQKERGAVGGNTK